MFEKPEFVEPITPSTAEPAVGVSTFAVSAEPAAVRSMIVDQLVYEVADVVEVPTRPEV
jgi:hypothetical protein